VLRFRDVTFVALRFSLVLIILWGCAGLLAGCAPREKDAVSDRVHRLHSDEWCEDERLGMPQAEGVADDVDGDIESTPAASETESSWTEETGSEQEAVPTSSSRIHLGPAEQDSVSADGDSAHIPLRL